jgi:hypothetical protein
VPRSRFEALRPCQQRRSTPSLRVLHQSAAASRDLRGQHRSAPCLEILHQRAAAPFPPRPSQERRRVPRLKVFAEARRQSPERCCAPSMKDLLDAPSRPKISEATTGASSRPGPPTGASSCHKIFEAVSGASSHPEPRSPSPARCCGPKHPRPSQDRCHALGLKVLDEAPRPSPERR